MPVWTGQPASSIGFIRALEGATAEGEPAALVALHALAALARESLKALERDDAVALVVLAARADAALETLGTALDRPITIDAHRELRRAVRSFGVAAKVSGAGGGDFSLLFGPRDLEWDAIFGAIPHPCIPFDELACSSSPS